MALKEVELRPGWFVFLCESCGFQTPEMGVKKEFLGAAAAPLSRNAADEFCGDHAKRIAAKSGSTRFAIQNCTCFCTVDL